MSRSCLMIFTVAVQLAATLGVAAQTGPDLAGMLGQAQRFTVKVRGTVVWPFAPEQTFVVPPAIQGIELRTNGTVLLRFLGAPGGTNYVLEASTNLTAWSAITNLSADSSGAFDYSETNVAGFPARFYRVLSP